MTSDEHRWVGQRFYNTEIGESFTVIKWDPPFAFIQYDDGVAWDEATGPDAGFDTPAVHPVTGEPITEPDGTPYTLGELMHVDSDGLDSDVYVHLGCGPSVAVSVELCPTEGDHDWFPLPSDIWGSDGAMVYDHTTVYHRTARCRRCGLSAEVVAEHRYHDVPLACRSCGCDLDPGSGDTQHFQHDVLYCDECIDEVER